MVKTNVMRILEKQKIAFQEYSYPCDGKPFDGVTMAAKIGLPESVVFKTLVARGNDKNIYVFVIPVACELDLKKAAKAVGVKSIAMVHVAELNGLTGYIRGGCSPIGMKKKYRTLIHSTANELDAITVSAGKIGCMVRLSPRELARLTEAEFTDLITED